MNVRLVFMAYRDSILMRALNSRSIKLAEYSRKLRSRKHFPTQQYCDYLCNSTFNCLSYYSFFLQFSIKKNKGQLHYHHIDSILFVLLHDSQLCLPPTGSGDILFFPVRLSVRPSIRPSVCLSVTNRVRSIT